MNKQWTIPVSGAENKAAVESMSTGKHGSSMGPSFDDLFSKFKDQGLSDEKAYQKIIESSKRTSPVINKKYDSKWTLH